MPCKYYGWLFRVWMPNPHEGTGKSLFDKKTDEPDGPPVCVELFELG